MKLGRVALDGSKVKAQASKHKAMSYGRTKETEKRLREEVRKWLNQAEAADQGEDSRYGRDRRGDELPEELQRRETRIARIREAQRALEERAREQAKSEGKDPEQAQPSKKAQHNFTDPESRMLKGPDGFVQGYTSTHPALPHEAARYANLKRILDRSLVTDPQKALTKVGRFEVAGEPSLPKSVLRPVQVRWTEPQS